MFCNSVGSMVMFRLLRSHQTVSRYEALPMTEMGEHSQLNRNKVGLIQTVEARLGSNIVDVLGNIQRREIESTSARTKFVLYSMIFSLNIAIGNVSLRHVSVNFNQVMRSLVPALTIVMGGLLGRHTSIKRKLAVVPIVMGVACACYGDMTYTTVGMFYTCMCVMLAALKVVASGEMLTGDMKLHPVDLLGHMAPLALVQCLALSLLTGEMSIMMSKPVPPPAHLALIIGGGLVSFSLNIASLQANKVTSPLTLCIAANVKQVSMIAIATILFATPIAFLNGVGIAVVLIGSSIYSYISVMEKTAQKQSSGGAVELGKNGQSTS